MRFTKLKYLFVVFLFSIFISEKLFSDTPSYPLVLNNDDSLKRIINKDARKASLMSMILPGLGQVYNKKYWKVPIIYAALGGLGYYALQKNTDYQIYHKELLYRYANRDTLTLNPSLKISSTANLVILKDQAKKYRDFFIIGMGVVYLLNIIDANIDAHLKTFDVSDKLSLGIKPKAFYCPNSSYGIAGGVSISLNFK